MWNVVKHKIWQKGIAVVLICTFFLSQSYSGGMGTHLRQEWSVPREIVQLDKGSAGIIEKIAGIRPLGFVKQDEIGVISQNRLFKPVVQVTEDDSGFGLEDLQGALVYDLKNKRVMKIDTPESFKENYVFIKQNRVGITFENIDFEREIMKWMTIRLQESSEAKLQGKEEGQKVKAIDKQIENLKIAFFVQSIGLENIRFAPAFEYVDESGTSFYIEKLTAVTPLFDFKTGEVRFLAKGLEGLREVSFELNFETFQEMAVSSNLRFQPEPDRVRDVASFSIEKAKLDLLEMLYVERLRRAEDVEGKQRITVKIQELHSLRYRIMVQELIERGIPFSWEKTETSSKKGEFSREKTETSPFDIRKVRGIYSIRVAEGRVVLLSSDNTNTQISLLSISENLLKSLDGLSGEERRLALEFLAFFQETFIEPKVAENKVFENLLLYLRGRTDADELHSVQAALGISELITKISAKYEELNQRINAAFYKEAAGEDIDADDGLPKERSILDTFRDDKYAKWLLAAYAVTKILGPVIGKAVYEAEKRLSYDWELHNIFNNGNMPQFTLDTKSFLLDIAAAVRSGNADILGMYPELKALIEKLESYLRELGLDIQQLIGAERSISSSDFRSGKQGYINEKQPGDEKELFQYSPASFEGLVIRQSVFDIFDGEGWTRSNKVFNEPNKGIEETNIILTFEEEMSGDAFYFKTVGDSKVIPGSIEILFGEADYSLYQTLVNIIRLSIDKILQIFRLPWRLGYLPKFNLEYSSYGEQELHFRNRGNRKIRYKIRLTKKSYPEPTEIGDVSAEFLENYLQMPYQFDWPAYTKDGFDLQGYLDSIKVLPIMERLGKIQELADWCKSNLEWSQELGNAATAAGKKRIEKILEQAGGVCYDHNILLGVMLRYVGIPARTVSGFRDSDGNGRVTTEETHMWVEAYYNNGWREFDGTGHSANRDFGNVEFGTPLFPKEGLGEILSLDERLEAWTDTLKSWEGRYVFVDEVRDFLKFLKRSIKDPSDIDRLKQERFVEKSNEAIFELLDEKRIVEKIDSDIVGIGTQPADAILGAMQDTEDFYLQLYINDDNYLYFVENLSEHIYDLSYFRSSFVVTLAISKKGYVKKQAVKYLEKPLERYAERISKHGNIEEMKVDECIYLFEKFQVIEELFKKKLELFAGIDIDISKLDSGGLSTYLLLLKDHMHSKDIWEKGFKDRWEKIFKENLKDKDFINTLFSLQKRSMDALAYMRMHPERLLLNFVNRVYSKDIERIEALGIDMAIETEDMEDKQAVLKYLLSRGAELLENIPQISEERVPEYFKMDSKFFIKSAENISRLLASFEPKDRSYTAAVIAYKALEILENGDYSDEEEVYYAALLARSLKFVNKPKILAQGVNQLLKIFRTTEDKDLHLIAAEGLFASNDINMIREVTQMIFEKYKTEEIPDSLLKVMFSYYIRNHKEFAENDNDRESFSEICDLAEYRNIIYKYQGMEAKEVVIAITERWLDDWGILLQKRYKNLILPDDISAQERTLVLRRLLDLQWQFQDELRETESASEMGISGFDMNGPSARGLYQVRKVLFSWIASHYPPIGSAEELHQLQRLRKQKNVTASDLLLLEKIEDKRFLSAKEINDARARDNERLAKLKQLHSDGEMTPDQSAMLARLKHKPLLTEQEIAKLRKLANHESLFYSIIGLEPEDVKEIGIADYFERLNKGLSVLTDGRSVKGEFWDEMRKLYMNKLSDNRDDEEAMKTLGYIGGEEVVESLSLIAKGGRNMMSTGYLWRVQADPTLAHIAAIEALGNVGGAQAISVLTAILNETLKPPSAVLVGNDDLLVKEASEVTKVALEALEKIGGQEVFEQLKDVDPIDGEAGFETAKLFGKVGDETNLRWLLDRYNSAKDNSTYKEGIKGSIAGIIRRSGKSLDNIVVEQNLGSRRRELELRYQSYDKRVEQLASWIKKAYKAFRDNPQEDTANTIIGLLNGYRFMKDMGLLKDLNYADLLWMAGDYYDYSYDKDESWKAPSKLKLAVTDHLISAADSKTVDLLKEIGERNWIRLMAARGRSGITVGEPAKEKDFEKINDKIIEALGRIGGPKAATYLWRMFKDMFKGEPFMGNTAGTYGFPDAGLVLDAIAGTGDLRFIKEFLKIPKTHWGYQKVTDALIRLLANAGKAPGKDLTLELGLTPEQAERLDKIISDHMEYLRAQTSVTKSPSRPQSSAPKPQPISSLKPTEADYSI